MCSCIRIQLNVNSFGNTEESASQTGPPFVTAWPGKQERWTASLDNIITKKRNRRALEYVWKEQRKCGAMHTRNYVITSSTQNSIP